MNDHTYAQIMEIEEKKKEPKKFSFRLQWNYYSSQEDFPDLKSAQMIFTIEAKDAAEAAMKGLNMKETLFGKGTWCLTWILHSVDRWDAYNYNGPG